MKKTIKFLFLVLFSVHSFGQNLAELDSTSIISYVDKIILKINIDTQTDIILIDDELTNTNFVLAPNSNLRLFLSLDYEFIGVSIGFSPKFLPGNSDDDLKGKSSFTDYSFRFFLGNWTQKLNYSSVQGYFIENTSDFIPDWVENVDPYIQFPNLKIIRWGGATSYVLNEKFSLRNVVYQTEWQRENAGSFIPELGYFFNKSSNEVNGINTSENAFDVQLAASYYYTWVIHSNWFISSFLSPALGVRFSNIEEEENGVILKYSNQHLVKTLDGGLQLGFSSRKIIFGVNVNFDINWHNEDKTTIVVDNKIYSKLYFGYRLNAPKAIQKPFKWINKQFGYE